VIRAKQPHPRPIGHVVVPAAAIGGLSVILVVGLQILRVIDRLNSAIARLVSPSHGSFPKHLPDWCVWLATAVFALALANAILSTPGPWKRLILWVSATVIVAAWAPVLSLAAHAPEIGAPWIATLWSGVCAIVYSANHRMPCDETPPPAHEPS
jgi:hypothetical protein